MNPSVGRIVHYIPEIWSADQTEAVAGPAHAAIITYVHANGMVSLTVFGVERDTKVLYSKPGNGEPGTWSWPPRV